MINAIMVGLGTRGRYMMRDRIVGEPRYNMLAGVDPAPTALTRMKEIAPDLKLLTDYEESLRKEDCDAVFILTPSAGHYEQAKAALEAGKHVYVEKPFTQSHRQAIELCRLADDRGVKLMVGQNMRFVPVIRQLQEENAQGNFGKIAYLSLASNRNVPNQDKLPRHDHVWLLDNAVHDWDQILAITGRRPVKIYTREFDTPWSRIKHGAAHSVIEFEDGLEVLTQGAFIAKSTEFRLRMETEKGTVIADSYRSYTLIDAESKKTDRVELPEDRLSGACETVKAFADYIESGIEPACSGRNNLRTIQLVCAGIRSSQQGKPVVIPQSTDTPVD